LSAKDRAFSRLERESLQEAIAAGNEWAKPWVRRRENKLTFLDSHIDQHLIKEAQSALAGLSRKADPETEPELTHILWNLVDALGVWYQILKRPVNVKVAVSKINEELELGLDSLSKAGFWKRVTRDQ
jgi:hypothetical protein